MARERVRINLPPFEDGGALLEKMDKPSLERLALDLHSPPEEANTQLHHELVSLLAMSNFQQQYTELCHAVMKVRDVPMPTLAQDADGSSE